MAPELGLVCITTSDVVRYRTMTRKRLLQLEPEKQQTLRDLYRENLRRLGVAIEFCHTQRLRLYRLISSTFPFADDPVGEGILTEFADGLRQIGDRAGLAVDTAVKTETVLAIAITITQHFLRLRGVQRNAVSFGILKLRYPAHFPNGCLGV